MGINLEAIQFNHDTENYEYDAFNIRKNRDDVVILPEWRRGCCINPEDSPAAYALKKTSGKTITIKAKFSCNEPSIRTAQIRAIDPIGPPHGCLYAILRQLGIIPYLPPPYGNCLGAVKEHTVSFSDGESDFEIFELKQFWPMKSYGVGIHKVEWHWFYQVDNGMWQNFENTYHSIYLVLDIPTEPWQQQPYNRANTQLPWTDALNVACAWARKSSNLDESSAMITRSFNTNPIHSYTPLTLFGRNIHHLSSYLNAFNSGVTFTLNCTDCTSVVTTLSNLVGCDLVEGKINAGTNDSDSYDSFLTREFLKLGGNPQETLDWVYWEWSYHEVSWLNKIGEDEFVYDGCLQLDMDDNDDDDIHIPQHPIKMRFKDYCFRLIESGEYYLDSEPTIRQLD